ncbi:MAG: nitric oxide reductase activation protein [Thiotrichales bacterium]|nr:MAG: nitric oxide reductase activation protein [Thiotrichales bacterium]
MARKARGRDEIIAFMDDCLEVEFSFVKNEIPAEEIRQLPRHQQDFILNLIKRVADTNIELAYQLACGAVHALHEMDERMVEEWAMTAADNYDRKGLFPAMSVIRNLDNFIHTAHERAHGSLLEEEIGVLLPFLHGLSGRKLKLEASDTTYTDTETIFLPPVMAVFADEKENFLLYKATVAHHWAQIQFGTFRADLSGLRDDQLAKFRSLETIRLDACIRDELPGLYRQMQALQNRFERTATASDAIIARLSSPEATVQTTLELLDTVSHDQYPGLCVYQGIIDPVAVAATMSKRSEREKAFFRVALADLARELNKTEDPEQEDDEPPATFNLHKPENEPGRFGNDRIQLEFEGDLVAPPNHVKQLMSSIVVDFGEIPPEYLVAAGPGEYDLSTFDRVLNPNDVWQGTYHEEGAQLYNEWNFKRQHYHKDWCVLREIDVQPVYDSFVEDTLEKYSKLLKSLRNTFEYLRGEDKLLKKQPHGDDIDIDALVEAYADVKSGLEMSNRLFTKMHKEERNVAVIFMVDMSGSTKGWINRAEREALILLAEVLEVLQDRYAIYGFSGMTRKRCELFRIKAFDDAYDAETRARISNIQPQDYTRMGVFIRHVIRHFSEVEASTKLLITLSDGKPDDYDTYRGEYGVEDTRQALFEARRDGIHAFCITIDEEARDYLPHMYGAANYTVIDDVASLPTKISDIYRRLTT